MCLYLGSHRVVVPTQSLENISCELGCGNRKILAPAAECSDFIKCQQNGRGLAHIRNWFDITNIGAYECSIKYYNVGWEYVKFITRIFTDFSLQKAPSEVFQ